MSNWLLGLSPEAIQAFSGDNSEVISTLNEENLLIPWKE